MFSDIDLEDSYHLQQIQEKDIHKVRYIILSRGHFEMFGVHYSINNAEIEFQKYYQDLITREPRMLKKICKVFIDDLMVYSTGMNQHINYIRSILDRLLSANLKSNWIESQWDRTVWYDAKDESTLVVYHWIRQKFKDWSTLHHQRRIQTLLWNQKLGQPMVWDATQERAHLYVDSSKVTAVLHLIREHKDIKHLIGFDSHTYTPTQWNYSTSKQKEPRGHLSVHVNRYKRHSPTNHLDKGHTKHHGRLPIVIDRY
eukprot:TRINITY_DN6795_c0_g1_i5.p1 TRINITY_DN6795_c0_g1~~TRINITY_DN6795_c0_g1_i5.p1  ORF type:complete len:294 (-),score=1.37 TRINITY_DN6795_c0_g1_i5:537-1304(-)